MDRADLIAKYVALKTEFRVLLRKKYNDKVKLSDSDERRMNDLDAKILDIDQLIKPEYLREINERLSSKAEPEPSTVSRADAVKAAQKMMRKYRDADSKKDKK